MVKWKRTLDEVQQNSKLNEQWFLPSFKFEHESNTNHRKAIIKTLLAISIQTTVILGNFLVINKTKNGEKEIKILTDSSQRQNLEIKKKEKLAKYKGFDRIWEFIFY